MNSYQLSYVNLMAEAAGAEEIDALYEKCCEKCKFAAFCSERKCEVTHAYEANLARVDKDVKLILRISGTFKDKTTKQPKKKTAEEKAAKACIRFLDRVAESTDDEELKFLIDDVTVQLCIGDTRAIDRLKEHYDVLYYKLARLWWKYTSVEETKKKVE